MLILAVDTSTHLGSVALARDGEILALAENPGESHSLWLLRSVDRLLKGAAVAKSSVDGYGIVIGPGSFTGLRIGIATVKGLAVAGGKPCAPVVSLDAMARAMAALRPGRLLAPAVDAKKGEVYFALYASSGGELRRTHEPAAAAPGELLRLASGGVIAGTGSDLCARLRGPSNQVEFISIPPIAPEVVRIAHAVLVSGGGVAPELIEPLYLRKSEAEIHEERGKGEVRGTREREKTGPRGERWSGTPEVPSSEYRELRTEHSAEWSRCQLPGFDLYVRPMTLADVPVVHAIEIRSYPNPWPAKSFEFELTSSPASRLWVVEEQDGTIVGYLATWLIEPELHINNMAISPEYRRRGLGSALLRFALHFGSASGADIATLEVRGANLAARSLYLKHGFVEVGLRAGYYLSPRDDAIIMSRGIGVATPSP